MKIFFVPVLTQAYDPQTGRFINADVVEILAYDQNSLFENNLFAYCVNDPVNKKISMVISL